MPIHYSVSGTPQLGYRIAGEIESSSDTVKIAGKANVLRNISIIEVPETVLDVTGQTQSLVKEVNLKDYLPDNVFLADSSDAVRTVTVPIEAEISKKLEIRGEKVRMTNVPEGCEASISELDESFVIEVVGLSRDVATLQAANINGTVDVSRWMNESGMETPEPGFYTVEVDFGLPENVSLRETVTVTLHISEPEQE